MSLMTLKSSTKIPFFFETANITLSFLLFPAKYADIASESAIFECFRKHYHDFFCQINAIYFIPPSQMTRKSNRTRFEEIFAGEDEYRLFYGGRVSSCFSNKLTYPLRTIFFMLPTSFPIIRTISRIYRIQHHYSQGRSAKDSGLSSPKVKVHHGP